MNDNCVSPQNALKNLDSMHLYLQTRLKSVNDASDLIPFINALMPINNLKIQLSSLLHTQLELQKNNKDSQRNNTCDDRIRSLYVSLCSLNGIPSDMIHAKIIEYLPSSEYKKLPMLSSHFRNIMRHFPFIYNHKQYSVDLLLKSKIFNKHSNNHNMPIINVMHNNHQIEIRADTKIHSTKASKMRPERSSKQAIFSFPLNEIHIWKLYSESTADWLWVGSDYKEENDNIYNDQQTIYTLNETQSNPPPNNTMTDGYNSNSIVLLGKSNNNIQRLDLENVNLLCLYQIFKKRNTFNQCIVLCIRRCPLSVELSKVLNEESFNKLEYLELWYPKQDKLYENKLCFDELMNTDPLSLSSLLDDRQLDQFYNHLSKKKVLCQSISNLLDHLQKTLISFVYHDENELEILSWGWDQQMLEHLCSSTKLKGILHIPSNVEWLSIRNCCFVIDLSKCNKLIACEILGEVHYKNVQWPSTHIIPFCYLSPASTKRRENHNISESNVDKGNHWKNLISSFAQNSHSDRNDDFNTYGDDDDGGGGVSHVPSVRFICLGQKLAKATPSLKFSFDPQFDDLNEVVDDNESRDLLCRHKICDVMVKDQMSNEYLMHRNGSSMDNIGIVNHNDGCTRRCDSGGVESTAIDDDNVNVRSSKECGCGCEGGNMVHLSLHKKNAKLCMINNLTFADRCLVLDKSEMSEALFLKLMNYAFEEKEAIRENKMQIYQKWWSLQCGEWISNIGNIHKWNTGIAKRSQHWMTTTSENL